MTKLILIATAMLSAATSPVFAREVRPAAASASSQSVDTTARTPATASPTKYCIIDTVTGSHIPHKTCKTRADWQRDDGFDPLAKN